VFRRATRTEVDCAASAGISPHGACGRETGMGRRTGFGATLPPSHRSGDGCGVGVRWEASLWRNSLMFQYVLDHGVPERVLGTAAKVAGVSCADCSTRENLTCVPLILVTISLM